MDSQRPSTPDTLTTNVDQQPNHLEVVPKVNNCAHQLTDAINELLETTKWDIERLKSENAELLQRLRETDDRYEVLEDAIMEKDEEIQQAKEALEHAIMDKDEEIQQKKEALESAEQENINLKHGRALAISLMTETQQTAAISEGLALKKAEKALEERDSAVNSRDAAENRAGDAEMARKKAETRAEQAEQAKVLAEQRAKKLESNQAYMISSRQQAEKRAEKAEADLAEAVERENEARRLLKVVMSMQPKKGSTNLNKSAKRKREFRDLESTYHDERLKELAQDLNRVVDDWGMEKERHILFRFTTDAITVTRAKKERNACQSSLRVRCVRHAKEVVITIFSVLSLARTIYGAGLDSKAAAELLRAYISQTVSRRHAQNLDVGEETERVTIFRWVDLVDILNEVAKVYHKPDLAAV